MVQFYPGKNKHATLNRIHNILLVQFVILFDCFFFQNATKTIYLSLNLDQTLPTPQTVCPK